MVSCVHNVFLCVYVCAAIPFILDGRVMDVPAGVTQDFCGACLDFLARMIQSLLSLADRDVEFCVLTTFSTCWAEGKSQFV